jgi:hypothetical protein
MPSAPEPEPTPAGAADGAPPAGPSPHPVTAATTDTRTAASADAGAAADSGAAGYRDPVPALEQLAGQPLSAHVEAYEALHVELQRALSEIDSA